MNSVRVVQVFYMCDFPDCGQRFTSREEMAAHKISHYDSPPIQSTSLDHFMSMGDASPVELPAHLDVPIMDAPTHYICSQPGCECSFPDKNTFLNHLNSHNSFTSAMPVRSASRFTCGDPDCSQSFNTRLELAKHNQLIHQPPTINPIPVNPYANDTGYFERPQYCCTFSGCDQSFLSKNGLVNHLNAHTGQYRFTCDHPGCTQGYTWQADLEKHKLVHLDRSQRSRHHCNQPGCTKSFLSRNGLLNHLNVHSRKCPFMCDVPGCKQGFTWRTDLMKHKQTHLNKEQRHRHMCTFAGCKKSYLSRGGLVNHLNVHLGQYPYVCDVPHCHQGFTWQGDLAKHKEAHERQHRLDSATVRRGSSTKRARHLLVERLDSDQDDYAVSGTLKSQALPCKSSYRIVKVNGMGQQTVSVAPNFDSGQEPVGPPVRSLFVCHVPGCTERFTSRSDLSQHKMLAHS